MKIRQDDNTEQYTMPFADLLYGVDMVTRRHGIGLQGEYGKLNGPIALLSEAAKAFNVPDDDYSIEIKIDDLLAFFEDSRDPGIVVQIESGNNKLLNAALDVLIADLKKFRREMLDHNGQ